jgi:uridine kinase
VIVLAGPSGAGKSRLADRLGLPVLRLDDFYKSGSDPTLPVIETGANAGLTDWDHPDSWHHHAAMAALRQLCAEGRATVPVYDIARDGRCGEQVLDLAGSPLFCAEGTTQHPVVTFWRRLTRDLRERRKPPLVLVRRGWALMRAQRDVVRHAVALGCEPVDPDRAYAEIRALQPVTHG